VSIEYHIGDGKTYRTFFVRSGNGTSEIRTESAPEAQLRVFMAEETWHEIATAELRRGAWKSNLIPANALLRRQQMPGA
jgi:hypothetical protein